MGFYLLDIEESRGGSQQSPIVWRKTVSWIADSSFRGNCSKGMSPLQGIQESITKTRLSTFQPTLRLLEPIWPSVIELTADTIRENGLLGRIKERMWLAGQNPDDKQWINITVNKIELHTNSTDTWSVLTCQFERVLLFWCLIQKNRSSVFKLNWCWKGFTFSYQPEWGQVIALRSR